MQTKTYKLTNTAEYMGVISANEIREEITQLYKNNDKQGVRQLIDAYARMLQMPHSPYANIDHKQLRLLVQDSIDRICAEIDIEQNHQAQKPVRKFYLESRQ